MTEQELIKKRGEIIEKTINVERLLDTVITQHYFNSIKINFLTEVLYDEYCSFGLKTNIISKITSNRKLYSSLKRLSNIRNYFAHTGLTLDEFVDKFDRSKGTKRRNPDPKKLEQDINYETLYTEFIKLESEVRTKLWELYLQKDRCATD